MPHRWPHCRGQRGDAGRPPPGLEPPLCWGHEALQRPVSAAGKNDRSGSDGNDTVRDHDADLVRVRRPGHHRGLEFHEPGVAGAGGASGAAAGVARSATPASGGDCTEWIDVASAFGLDLRAAPATMSKRNRRHSIAPFHNGTRRDSLSRIVDGNRGSGLSTHAVHPA